jgi:hypothetical protein
VTVTEKRSYWIFTKTTGFFVENVRKCIGMRYFGSLSNREDAGADFLLS